MCGIFGWSFNERPKNVEIAMTVLADRIERRGQHGWGWFGWDGADRVSAKGKGPWADGADTPHVFSLNAAACHVRYATMGAKNDDNAHPYEVGRIIGSHNGQIRNSWSLDKKHKRDVKVDSQHIFLHLAERKDMTELRGYGAVQWHDSDALDVGELYLWRFNHEDMHVIAIGKREKDSIQGIMWASEHLMLVRAMELSGLPWFNYVTPEYEIFIAKPAGLFKTNLKWQCKQFEYIETKSAKGWVTHYGAGFRESEEPEKDSLKKPRGDTVTMGYFHVPCCIECNIYFLRRVEGDDCPQCQGRMLHMPIRQAEEAELEECEVMTIDGQDWVVNTETGGYRHSSRVAERHLSRRERKRQKREQQKGTVTPINGKAQLSTEPLQSLPVAVTAQANDEDNGPFYALD